MRELRRSPLLVAALVAAVGGAAIYLVALPALWRMSWPHGVLIAGLGAAQLGTAVAVLARPVRRRILLAAAAALAVVVLWALVRLAGVLPTPDPWVPVNSVIGFTDYICAGLQATATVGLAGVAALGPRPRRSLPRQVLAAVGLAPLVVLVLLGVVVGVVASSAGFAGAGFPAGTVASRKVPSGQMSTVEYCRPDGVPLAMDLYMPPAARTGRPAPVAMYVHGGGLWGDRKMYGLGARQANHEGALFTPLHPRCERRRASPESRRRQWSGTSRQRGNADALTSTYSTARLPASMIPRIAAALSPRNTAEPATSTRAPARTISGAVLSVMPPSTMMGRPLISRTRRTFSAVSGMKACPPKPGFTLMTLT